MPKNGVFKVKRLEAVASLVLPGEPAADIGADHLQLSLYLIEKGICPWVIVSELGEGPFGRAQKILENSTCQEQIELRQGDGMAVLDVGEVHTVVIAGMGGDTICGILERDWDKAGSFKRLVFQPMSRAWMLRRVLASQGWIITDELLVNEHQRFFVLMAAHPGGEPYYLTPLEEDVGPVLMRSQNPLLYDYLKSWRDKYRAICNNLICSQGTAEKQRLYVYQEKMQELEVLISAGQG
ncbi:tRNA (adenine(22)-N(1))-methyltransferase [Syntrophomonas erecta]